MSRFARILLAAIVAVGSCRALPQEPPPATTADYIVGFVRYVRWQDEDRADAWSICTHAAPSPAAERAFAAATVRGKPFRLRVAGPAELAGCHVVDLVGLDAGAARPFLTRLRGQPVLSVGRGSEFCSAGGLICLTAGGEKRRFDINLSAVRDSGLRVSARLLMLGTERPPAREPSR